VSEIERIPSMRKGARQGVPKKSQARPRSMARPAEPEPEPELKREPQGESGPEAQPVLEPEPIPSLASKPEPFVELGPESFVEPEPTPQALVEAEPEPEPEPKPAPQALVEAEPEPPPLTLRELFRRVDGAWYAFRAAAARFPAERMDEHLTEDGWTRKQMLAHIAAWHDLTSDRLVKLIVTGRPFELDRDTDAINAGVARIAIGKTAGEVLKDVEATFNRLRRQMQRLSDAQLHQADGWAAHIIAGNTYEHYAEHMADLYMPEPTEGAQRR